MRAIKFLVVAMGVVLIVGFTVVAVEVVRRATTGRPAADATEAPGDTPYAARVDMPAGARVGAVVATGERVVIQVIMPEGGAILYAFDPATGAAAGTISIMGEE